MQTTRWWMAAGLALAVTGCGDDDEGGNPLVALYAVERHDLSEMGCDDPLPLVDPQSCFGCTVETPYFKVKEQSFFGSPIVTTVECEAADRCSDDDDPDAIDIGGALFDHKEGDAWVGTATAAGTGGASCSYSRTTFRLEPIAEGVVRLTRTVHRNTPESPSGMLMGDACLALSENGPPETELECDEMEIVEGRAVEQ